MRRIKVDTEKLYGAMRGRIREFCQWKGKHPNTISNKLNGHTKIHFEDLNDFAEFLGRNAIEFLEEVEWTAAP